MLIEVLENYIIMQMFVITKVEIIGRKSTCPKQIIIHESLDTFCLIIK